MNTEINLQAIKRNLISNSIAVWRWPFRPMSESLLGNLLIDFHVKEPQHLS